MKQNVKNVLITNIVIFNEMEVSIWEQHVTLHPWVN